MTSTRLRSVVGAVVSVVCFGGPVQASPRVVHGAPPSYTVAQVRDGIARAPRQWEGRTVRVRGSLQPYCSPAKGCHVFILNAWHVVRGGRPPELVLRIASASLILHPPITEKMAVYRIKVLPPRACTVCNPPQHADALLLDRGV